MDSEEDRYVKRQELFNANHNRLAQLAYRAQSRGQQPMEVLIVCIEADDEDWSSLAQTLMPDRVDEWKSMRAQGMIPIARGTANGAVVDYIKEVAPSVKSALETPPPIGQFRVAVCGAGGVSIYLIAPQPES